MLTKLRSFLYYVPDVLILVSLILSIVANIRVSSNSRDIASLVESVATIQSDVSEMNVTISKRFDAIQVQLDFIAKYSEANYLYFYGDVDGRNSTINKPDNSKSKIKN